jgi:hypothetical protein
VHRVAYGRLRKPEATQTLASLYEVSRLYINFFQPTFKLKSKTSSRERHESALMPLERIVRSASVPDATKRRLAAQFRALDPLDLLSRMREAHSMSRNAGYSATPLR